MSKLYIIRGLPGSGKSTLARRLSKQLNAEHWEADMFFVDKEGNYKFDLNKLHAAHEWCIRNVEDAMFHNVDVIVSNTFTRPREMEDYLVTAERLDVEMFIIECTNSYGSIHNVPSKTMSKMRDRWISNENLQKFMTSFSNLYDGLTVHYQKAEDYVDSAAAA